MREENCHDYGISRGCDEYCPQMLRGECEFYDENFKEREE